MYYRLSVIPIRVPSLRERREDIPLLVNHFLKKYAPAAGKSILRVDAASLSALCGYDWPGNVRQLENTIERAVALETGNELHVELPVERPKAQGCRGWRRCDRLSIAARLGAARGRGHGKVRCADRALVAADCA